MMDRAPSDLATCSECRSKYSVGETRETNSTYFPPPYDDERGSSNHCLACWLGVGPRDLPPSHASPAVRTPVDLAPRIDPLWTKRAAVCASPPVISFQYARPGRDLYPFQETQVCHSLVTMRCGRFPCEERRNNVGVVPVHLRKA
jgi:hypothetical protein